LNLEHWLKVLFYFINKCWLVHNVFLKIIHVMCPYIVNVCAISYYKRNTEPSAQNIFVPIVPMYTLISFGLVYF
jgi:hypothetical protein